MSRRLLGVAGLLLLCTACPGPVREVEPDWDTGWGGGCLELTPSELELEVLRPGESASGEVIVGNGCNGWLEITEIYLEGRNADRFEIVGETSAELGSAEAYGVEVVFAPEEDGAWEAALWVTSTDAWTEQTWVALAGRVLASGR